ncbi:DUF3223 domain-containing protein [Yersinia enterocolitica]|uniref:DUF3223 domain-containing protein n=1 Tax=Yersinia enterocolitica TaxID=630 RepID=UPI0005DCD2C6|nr:DUF3223 domain-containing protein [Yersinia enterocolitica]CNK45878.1 Protein of uncharacterised function (DUF3223) [Yersinia enterocolitica]
MTYIVNGEIFRTKKDVTDKCKSIKNKTKEGDFVEAEDHDFLINLFQLHDGWEDKSKAGVKHITTGKSDHGTTCFYLVPISGEKQIDISYPYIITNFLKKNAFSEVQ